MHLAIIIAAYLEKRGHRSGTPQIIYVQANPDNLAGRHPHTDAVFLSQEPPPAYSLPSGQAFELQSGDRIHVVEPVRLPARMAEKKA